MWCNGEFNVVLLAVLSEVSSEDHAGKQLCETARAICTNAQKLKQEMEYEENKASKSNSKKDPACECDYAWGGGGGGGGRERERERVLAM